MARNKKHDHVPGLATCGNKMKAFDVLGYSLAQLHLKKESKQHVEEVDRQ